MIPVNVIDLVEKLQNPNVRDPEKTNLLQRVETIRDYCNSAVVKFNNKNSMKNYNRKNK